VRVGEGEQTAVGYDAVRGRLFVDRTRSGEAAFAPSFAAVHEAPLPRQDGRVSFSVWIDVASVEVFGGRGEVAITDQIFPRTSSRGLALFAEGGPARLVALEVAPLRP
jgi:fructan beta-fructosidase